tara:strand:+ start:1188 stop:1712 length:525 start_codon:yes stop_codon:yes gene_type:complete
MNSIDIKFDIETRQFILEDSSNAHGYSELNIKFVGDSYPVDITDVRFGYELTKNSEIISAQNYPKDQQRYISSDGICPLCSAGIFLIPTTEYTISMWCLYRGTDYRDSFTFNSSKPSSPYASWTWDDSTKQWNAPVDMPIDTDIPYAWDESTQSWIRPQNSPYIEENHPDYDIS